MKVLTNDEVRDILIENRNNYIDTVYNDYQILDVFRNYFGQQGQSEIHLKVKCLKHSSIDNIKKRNFVKDGEACKICRDNKKSTMIHGFRKKKHPLYKTYTGIKERCYNENHTHYDIYGKIGIKMCDRWFKSFENFANDLYPSYLETIDKYPNKRITLDRINNNNDIGYKLENVRWATPAMQAQNRSTTAINENIVKIVRYELEYCNFLNGEVINRYNSKLFRHHIQSCVSGWRNIENINDFRVYLEILNIEQLHLTSEFINDTKLRQIKKLTTSYMFNKLEYDKNYLGMIYGLNSNSIKQYSNIKTNLNDEQFIFLLYLVRSMINKQYLKDTIKRKLNIMNNIFKIRNDFEIYNLSLDEIYKKYSYMNVDRINDIITYKIANFYKPYQYFFNGLYTNPSTYTIMKIEK